jgi:hypothetical protein
VEPFDVGSLDGGDLAFADCWKDVVAKNRAVVALRRRGLLGDMLALESFSEIGDSRRVPHCPVFANRIPATVNCPLQPFGLFAGTAHRPVRPLPYGVASLEPIELTAIVQDEATRPRRRYAAAETLHVGIVGDDVAPRWRRQPPHQLIAEPLCHGQWDSSVRAVSASVGLCGVGLWRALSAAVNQNALIYGADSHVWGEAVSAQRLGKPVCCCM